jgi:hypothetical protein
MIIEIERNEPLILKRCGLKYLVVIDDFGDLDLRRLR